MVWYLIVIYVVLFPVLSGTPQTPQCHRRTGLILGLVPKMLKTFQVHVCSFPIPCCTSSLLPSTKKTLLLLHVNIYMSAALMFIFIFIAIKTDAFIALSAAVHLILPDRKEHKHV